MAECLRFVCKLCSYSIESWSDGNPYYYGKDGEKIYAYHPSGDATRCVGNDTPYICVNCAETFTVDSNSPQDRCPKCEKASILASFDLRDKTCPSCHKGKLSVDPEFHCIS